MVDPRPIASKAIRKAICGGPSISENWTRKERPRETMTRLWDSRGPKRPSRRVRSTTNLSGIVSLSSLLLLLLHSAPGRDDECSLPPPSTAKMGGRSLPGAPGLLPSLLLSGSCGGMFVFAYQWCWCVCLCDCVCDCAIARTVDVTLFLSLSVALSLVVATAKTCPIVVVADRSIPERCGLWLSNDSSNGKKPISVSDAELLVVLLVLVSELSFWLR
mmetsp:Transcript_14897/g.30857  ORF Transcript_14897/g.30857 Transcript_14897/m.30857 type:complete len:217 (+) Transcript_14897:1261-1911(+)